MSFIDRKKLGAGVGLRAPHRDLFLSDSPPDVSWVEVITENYLPSRDGLTLPLQNLLRLRERYPVALHGVSLNLGSVDPLNPDYLRQLAWLEREVEPWLVSDHLSWTGVGAENLHDLLPLPSTAEALAHVAARVQKVQDLLKRPIAIENISFYARPLGSEMPEHALLAELVKRTGCRILLDVNNLYVNSVNLGLSPVEFVAALDPASVAQVHLAGHSESSYGFLIDTHGAPVPEPVWALYESLLPRLKHAPAMIERDANIPVWAELGAEVGRLQKLIDNARKGAGRGPRRVAETRP